MPSLVSQTPAAASPRAIEHFQSALEFETDCWDVQHAMSQGQHDFVLLDTRSHELYLKGHVPGALSLPHGKIVESKMAEWPAHTLFVTYCAGPHCNAGHKGALRLARMGRPVKLMIGGATGWLDEGFSLKEGHEA